MKERAFNAHAHEVRAILAGRQTQFRRVVKLVGADTLEEREDGSLWPCASTWADGDERGPWLACPYGAPGDRLWVRETWGVEPTAWGEATENSTSRTFPVERWSVHYVADHALQNFAASSVPSAWKRPKASETGSVPSIHMPRWASRITLEVVNVRVERLNDISAADAIDEGLLSDTENGQTMYAGFPGDSWGAPILSYKALWESINGAESWAANPWVWVTTFKRVTP